MRMMLKIVAFFLAAMALMIAFGVSGLAFYCWPTSMGDETLALSPQAMQELSSLRAESKFVMDVAVLYPGAPDETMRASAQNAVDRLLDTLLVELPKHPRRAMVLGQFKQAMRNFPISESEERDRFLGYLQRIMDVLGISDSGELLNVWRYGFPYGWFF